MYHIFLRNSNDNIVETALLQSGIDYNDHAKALNDKQDKNEDGGDAVELDSLGPPFLHVMSSLAFTLATAAASVTPLQLPPQSPAAAEVIDADPGGAEGRHRYEVDALLECDREVELAG